VLVFVRARDPVIAGLLAKAGEFKGRPGYALEGSPHRWHKADLGNPTAAELARHAEVLRGRPVALVRIGAIRTRNGEKPSDAARRWLAANPQNNLVRPGLGRVVFDDKSIDDTLSHKFGEAKLNALVAVPDVVRRGVELYAGKNWDGRPLFNRVIAAPIMLNGDRYILFVRLRRNMTDPNAHDRFYVHEAELERLVENDEANPDKSGPDPDALRGRESHRVGFYVSLARRALAVNRRGGTLWCLR